MRFPGDISHRSVGFRVPSGPLPGGSGPLPGGVSGFAGGGVRLLECVYGLRTRITGLRVFVDFTRFLKWAHGLPACIFGVSFKLRPCGFNEAF